jgi:hypothetical protein
MPEPVDPAVMDYIRATRGRYTREAVTDRLQELGRSPAEIEQAWELVEAEGPLPATNDYRPGWVEWAVLVALGAIGAFLVWQDEPYGAGGIAPVVYIGAASLAFAVGKGGSMAVDSAQSLWLAVGAGLVAAAVAFWLIASPVPSLALFTLLGALTLGVLTYALHSINPRVAGYIGAAFPVLGWLVVTGVCYSPLFGR